MLLLCNYVIRTENIQRPLQAPLSFRNISVCNEGNWLSAAECECNSKPTGCCCHLLYWLFTSPAPQPANTGHVIFSFCTTTHVQMFTPYINCLRRPKSHRAMPIWQQMTQPCKTNIHVTCVQLSFAIAMDRNETSLMISYLTFRIIYSSKQRSRQSIGQMYKCRSLVHIC